MYHESNCILCYCVCPISDNPGQGNIRNSTCQLVDDQLTAIFTVAQLLEIPRALCQNLLSQSGNPSEWMTRCDRCNELVNNAYKTFKEVHHLQNKYVDLKLSIKTRVLNSRSLNSVNPHNNVTKTTERIRKFVFKDLPPVNSVQKLDSDVQPSVVIKTDPDLVLKVENDIDIHEENDWASENYNDHHGISLSRDIFEPGAVEESSKKKDIEEGEESESNGEEDEDSNDRDWEGDDNSGNSNSENEESQQQATVENESTINRDGKMSCEDCGKTYRTLEMLRNHIRSRHKGHHTCRKCKKTFRTRSCLAQHYKRMHPEDKGDLKSIPAVKVQCDVCGQSYSEEYINTHKKTHSENYVKPEKERKFECEECGLKCLRLVHLETHMAAKHKGLPFKCEICSFSVKSRNSLWRHYKRRHPEDKEIFKSIPPAKIKCDICGKSYCEAYLKEHKRTHSEDFDPSKGKTQRSKKYKCEECGLECAKASHLERHKAAKHAKDLPFKCTQCHLSFTNFTSLRKHVKRTHPEVHVPLSAPKIPCEICGQLYSEEYIKTHLSLHSEKVQKKFKCEICEDGFDIEDDLEVHKRGLHFKELNLEPYECKECDKTFKSDKWLQCHNIKEHSTTGDYCCPFCDKQQWTLTVFERHVKSVHEAEKFPCDQCYRVFTNKTRLEAHVTSQHKNNFECEICKKVFLRSEWLRYHRRGKHYKELNLEPIQCEECGKIFKSNSSLAKHTVDIHTKDFKEFCSICNMGFYNKNSLSVHTRQIHDKEKNFTCSFCGMAFFASNQLKMHTIAKHTMEYAVICEICGHGSPSEPIHKKHMKRHGTKSYACEVCGDAFAMQYELTDHQRGRHYQELGLEPFQCTECDKICNGRTSLKLHFTREHTKVSKLQCSYCEKQFLTNQKLLNHVRKIHNGEKPYQCEVCGDAFFTTQQKQKHFQIHNVP